MNTYEENRVLSATPIELVWILYAAALQAVEDAREHVRAGDIALRSRAIAKASAILFELTVSIDRNRDQEFATRLIALYDYMQNRLADANMQQQDSPLAEVAGLLGTLHEAWLQCPELAAA
jgi:flagellar protein FliS